MDSTYYFSHDYNSRHDIKITKLLMKHGMMGYGLYWAVLEELYMNNNSLPTDYDALAYIFRESSAVIKSVVCEFDLFTIEQGYFYSDGVGRRLEIRAGKSLKAKYAAEARYKKANKGAGSDVNKAPNAGGDCSPLKDETLCVPTENESGEPAQNMHTQCGCNADAVHMQCICNTGGMPGKERKGKESKEKKSKENICLDKNKNFSAVKSAFENYYEEKVGEKYYFTGADAIAVTQLVNKLRHNYKDNGVDDPTENQLASALTYILKNHGQSWIDENLSVKIINSKYNELISAIKRKRNSDSKLKQQIINRVQSAKNNDRA